MNDIDEKVDQDLGVADAAGTPSMLLHGLDPPHIIQDRFHQHTTIFIDHLQPPKGIVG